MKFIFELVSRSTDEPNVEQKHKKVVEGLLQIERPWGLEPGNYSFPEFGKGITSVFQLNRLLGDGIKGDVMYSFRRHLSPEDDDRVYLEFNPKKVNCQILCKQIFEKYVSIFSPYMASVFNEDVTHYDYENRGKYDLKKFFRFNPIFFIDEQYCLEKIGMSLAAFKMKIANEVEHVELSNNGIIVVVNSRILNLDESNDLNVRLQKAVFD